MNKGNLKVITYNILIFIVLVSFIEIILGKWRSSSPAFDIPRTIINKKIKFDASKISGVNSLINYSRDKDGYRNFSNKAAKKYFLTIGGSTTDQRYVSDGFTYQDLLEKKLGENYGVINAGVDGQTSYGHLISIRNWHSKLLDKNKLDKIIFYFGVNDVKFVKFGVKKGQRETWKSRSITAKIRNTELVDKISKKSFFYYWLRRIKYKFIINRSADGNKNIGHGNVNPEFIDEKKITLFYNFSLDKIHEEYINLIKNLAIETNRYFPNSELIFVQQPDPKCSFKDIRNVAARALILKKIYYGQELIDYCKNLGIVYLAQDEAFKSIKDSKVKSKINVLKMYIDNPIPNKGFYDGIHTNKIASKYIANYLFEKIKNK
tara:strand:+ start:5397 stop:6524 length:1128 start_codon:yes stop_codon:yes gene_type:complete